MLAFSRAFSCSELKALASLSLDTPVCAMQKVIAIARAQPCSKFQASDRVVPGTVPPAGRYIQTFKRIVTLAQQWWPSDPSKYG